MRKFRNIPRILRIIKIDDFWIYCVFNNGEYRIIDFNKVLEEWNPDPDMLISNLKDPKKFQLVEVRNGTLAWTNIKDIIKLPSGEVFETCLDLDPVVLYKFSTSDEKANSKYGIGKMLKEERIKAGLTQQELAVRSGTTKNYISRIENSKSDIELRTLRKIIEIGLNRNLDIAIS